MGIPPLQALDQLPRLVEIRGWLLAERLDTRTLEREGTLATVPLALSLAQGAIAVLFRYGAVILFNADPVVERDFLARLAPALTDALAHAEKESARLRIDPATEEQVESSGLIVIRQATIERLQMIAVILAKSLVLAHYEARLADVFDRIDPLAAKLVTKGRSGAKGRELMQHIGKVLLIQHKMVGRVEIGEKPELLWEHPELERLYGRLAAEYELRDRDRALDRKLDVIARTVETLLGLVQNRSSLRVEWYILALIAAELIFSIYQLSLWR